jgi:predicted porin
MRDNFKRPMKRKLTACAAAALLVVGMTPALADTDADIGALKKELEAQRKQLTEQNKLIQQLLGDQEARMQAPAPAAPTASAGNQPGLQKQDDLKPAFTFYGTLDVNVIDSNSGFGNKVNVGTGGMYASSLGVKLQRDLGSSLHAFGEFEAGLGINYGTVGNGAAALGTNNGAPSSGGLLGTGSQVFSRQAYVGIGSDRLGSISAGRQYAPSYIAIAGHGNAMGGGFFGNSATLLASIGGMPTRFNNALAYVSPVYSGFKTELEYTTGTENNVAVNTAIGTTTTTATAGRGYDLALFYKNGAFDSMLTTWNVKAATFVTAGESGLATKRGVQLVANYDFGFMKLYGLYVTGKIDGGNYENVTKTLSKSSGGGLSGQIPFGKSKLYLEWAHLNDDSLADRDGTLFGAAYAYEISPGYKVYASWGKLINNRNATYALLDGSDILGNVTRSGFSPSGFMTGLNYAF